MKNISLLFLSLFTLIANGQDFKVVPNETLSLTGYVDGVRTVWFSPDNTMIHADGAQLLSWQIQSAKLTQKIDIPGYNTYQSRISSDYSVWIQPNSNYNDPAKKNIADMHPNLNVYVYAADYMSSHKLTGGYNIHEVDFLEFRPNQILAVTSSPPSYIYELKIISLETYKSVLTIKKCDTNKEIMSCVGTSEDGKIAAVGYAGKNSKVEIWDMVNLKLIGTVNTPTEVSKVAIANGVCAASGSKKVYIIDTKSGELSKTINTTAGTFALAISPNGKSVAVGDRIGGADVIDVSTGKVQHFFTGQCQSLAFDSKGNMLAVGVFKTLHVEDIPSVFIYFNENKHEEDIEEHAEEPIIEKETSWFTYSSNEPPFSIDIPAEANEAESENSSGSRHVQVKSFGTTSGALIDYIEAKKVKPKKYYSSTVSVSEKFLENMGEIKLLESSDWQLKDETGVHRVFTKKEYTYYYRAIIIDGYLIQLTFFTKDSKSSDYQKFFDSLKWGA